MKPWRRWLDRLALWLDRTAQQGVLRPAVRGARRTLRWLRALVFDIEVDPDLLPGECVRVKTHRHWVASVPAVMGTGLGLLLLAWGAWPGDPTLSMPLLVVSLLVLALALDRLQRLRKDVFVVTDQRVMRLSGVYSRKEAEMPLARVLDITVKKPFWLRPLGAGHLILENAGQEQGLREVRYIPRPSEVKRAIAEQHAPRRPRVRSQPHAQVRRPDARHWRSRTF